MVTKLTDVEPVRDDTRTTLDALGAVWARILDRVEADLRLSERIAKQMLEGVIDEVVVREALDDLEAASEWLADLGMVAAARGARALRDHLGNIDADGGRDVGGAVVTAGLIEGVRSSVDAISGASATVPADPDDLLVVGAPNPLLDNVIWFAASSGFVVHHRHGLEPWPDSVDAVLVVDSAEGSLTASLLACRSVKELANDTPLIVVTDRFSAPDRAELAHHASSLLSSRLRTAEVIDEVRRHLHVRRRPLVLAVRGSDAEEHAAALTSGGLESWTADSDGELLTGLESARASGLLLLPAEDNGAVARLLRSQPSTRSLTIVEVLDGESEDATGPGMDATIESVEVIGARAGQLAELLRQRVDLDFDVSDLRRVGGVPWASATFLAERSLLSAHRTDAVVSVCVIRYGEDEDVTAIDAVQDALLREFRTDDIVARNGDSENILVLGGVGAAVTHARFQSIVERSSTPGSMVGIAEFPLDAQSLPDLVDEARSAIRRSMEAENGQRVTTADWRPERAASADVIVADADTASSRVVARSLTGVGQRVEHIADGAVLLERLRDVTIEQPKMLILEFDLLSVDGLTVLRRLNSRGALRHLDVVMLSSRNREADLRQAYDLGVVDVIEKPFSPGILVRRLLRVLEADR